MLKKLLCLLSAICMGLCGLASAEGGPEAVTAAELEALLASVLEQTAAGEILNNPVPAFSLKLLIFTPKARP